MEDIEKIKMYNHLCDIATINLYTLSKEKQSVRLLSFNFKDKKDLFILNIAKSLNTLYKFKIIVESRRLPWFIYRLTHKYSKAVEHRNFLTSGIKINDFLKHISDAQNVKEDIWEDIYDEFYSKANL